MLHPTFASRGHEATISINRQDCRLGVAAALCAAIAVSGGVETRNMRTRQEDATVSWAISHTACQYRDTPWNAENKIASTIKMIEQFHELPKGWDGYDAAAPSKQTIDDAVNFSRVISAFVDIQHVAPTADNEILFYWDGRNGVAAISCRGHSRVHAYISIHDEDFCYDGVPISFHNISVFIDKLQGAIA